MVASPSQHGHSYTGGYILRVWVDEGEWSGLSSGKGPRRRRGRHNAFSEVNPSNYNHLISSPRFAWPISGSDAHVACPAALPRDACGCHCDPSDHQDGPYSMAIPSSSCLVARCAAHRARPRGSHTRIRAPPRAAQALAGAARAPQFHTSTTRL